MSAGHWKAALAYCELFNVYIGQSSTRLESCALR
jgi:hypothetical protein